MVTEEDYRLLSERVYDVDSQKDVIPFKENQKILDGRYKVLKAKDNRANGMQAMAVAPVDKNGNVDYNEVVIAYAGTNSADGKDIETDYQSLGLGSDKLKLDPVVEPVIVTDSQFVTALKFAKQVEKEVKKHNFKAVITTTGHSLGGSLSMYVALKHGYASVTYNGPDVHNLISLSEIRYMQKHAEQFRNYRNKHDDIGNITGNKTKTAIYPNVTRGKDKFKDTLKDHLLSQWKFNKDGQLVDLDGKVVTDKVVAAYALMTAAMARINVRSKQLAKGGYSGREQIFLDAVQGEVVAQGMAAAAQAGSEDISRVVTEGVDKALSLWDAIDFSSYQELSYDEVLGLFAANGVTHDTIVNDTQKVLSQGASNGAAMTEEFATLNTQVQSVVQELMVTDKHLAEDMTDWIV